MDPVRLQVDTIPTSSSSLYISFTWGRVDRGLHWLAWEQQVPNILGNWKIRDRFALITPKNIGPIPIACMDMYGILTYIYHKNQPNAYIYQM